MPRGLCNIAQRALAGGLPRARAIGQMAAARDLGALAPCAAAGRGRGVSLWALPWPWGSLVASPMTQAGARAPPQHVCRGRAAERGRATMAGFGRAQGPGQAREGAQREPYEVSQGQAPAAAPGPGRSPSPGFIQVGRALHIPQFGAASLAAPSASRSSTGWALGFLVPLPTSSRAGPRGARPARASAPQPLWATSLCMSCPEPGVAGPVLGH